MSDPKEYVFVPLITVKIDDKLWGFAAGPNGYFVPVTQMDGKWIASVGFPPILALYIKPLLTHTHFTAAVEQNQRALQTAAGKTGTIEETQLAASEPRKLN